jgi:RND family efflux transporter MFP subunit
LIALAESELEQDREAYEHLRELVKKGYRTPEQLRAKELEVRRSEYYLERDKQKLSVLEMYDSRRKITEFETKAEQAEQKLKRTNASSKAELAKAESEFEAAKATLDLEKKRLEEMEEQRKKCTIAAAQDGVVAYANENWYSSDRQIREGAVVYFRQKIFSLPDMSTMQVQVNVHESLVKKVKPSQVADIRVDAVPNVPLKGTVKSVSPLADSTRSWMRGGVKEYTTVVTVNELPTDQLKPGMTAEVEVLVSELDNVLAVPVQAITEHRHEQYAYVRNGTGFDRRKVKIGESNQKMVEVVEGLAEGDMVALDARKRGLAEFDTEEPGAPPAEVPETAPASPKTPEVASAPK